MDGFEGKFNLQTYLAGMREEQQSNHREIHAKLDDMTDSFNDHETRITVHEKYWTFFGRTVAGVAAAALAGGFGWLVAYLS